LIFYSKKILVNECAAGKAAKTSRISVKKKITDLVPIAMK